MLLHLAGFLADAPERLGLLQRLARSRRRRSARARRRPRKSPPTRSRNPVSACDDSSISTYQGCGAASGSRVPSMISARRDRHPMRVISSKLVTCAPARSSARPSRSTAACTEGTPKTATLDRARPRQQPQHRRGDDAERAFGADEQVLQVVAGIVLVQLVEVVAARARPRARPRGRAHARARCHARARRCRRHWSRDCRRSCRCLPTAEAAETAGRPRRASRARAR